MSSSVDVIQKEVQKKRKYVDSIFDEMHKVIVGQDEILRKIIIGLLANGHILLEGVPGLAKTMTIKTLSEILEGDYQRMQFTPDLIPADLIGTRIYNHQTGEFGTKKGPIFANFILADEINRAPAKVQSALLEAMQEKQVTIGDETFQVPLPFFVLATENPIEQEGTYPLPEAQVDRFMLKLVIDYPSKEEEKAIVERMTQEDEVKVTKDGVDMKKIMDLQKTIRKIYIDEKVLKYIIDIVHTTRKPEEHGLKDLQGLIAYGASPRASIYLTLCAKANAFLHGRGYVIPEDIKEIGMDVLRHRIIPTYEAEAEEVTSEDIVRRVFDGVTVP